MRYSNIPICRTIRFAARSAWTVSLRRFSSVAAKCGWPQADFYSTVRPSSYIPAITFPAKR